MDRRLDDLGGRGRGCGRRASGRRRAGLTLVPARRPWRTQTSSHPPARRNAGPRRSAGWRPAGRCAGPGRPRGRGGAAGRARVPASSNRSCVGERPHPGAAAPSATGRASPARRRGPRRCTTAAYSSTLWAPVQGAPHRPMSASAHGADLTGRDSRCVHWRSGMTSWTAATAASAEPLRPERADVAGAVGADLADDREPGERLRVSLTQMARSGFLDRRL